MVRLAPTLSSTPINESGSEEFSREALIQKFFELTDPQINNALEAYSKIRAAGPMMQSLSEDMTRIITMDEVMMGEQTSDEFTYLSPVHQYPANAQMLRAVGESEPAMLIKNNRRYQLREFGRPSFTDDKTGFTLCFEDEERVPTPDEKELLRHITIQIVNKFFNKVGRNSTNDAMPLGSWLGMAYSDFFDMDDISFEIRRAGDGTPLGFHTVDPTIIAPILPKAQDKQSRNFQRWDIINDQDAYEKISKTDSRLVLNGKDMPAPEPNYAYMMIKNQRRYAKFTTYKMVKSHFFESSDWRRSYRGYSITQMGIRQITNIINAITYNASNFSNSSAPKGVFAYLGGMTNRRLLDSHTRAFHSYLANPAQKHRVPLMATPAGTDLKWIAMNANNDAMGYDTFMSLLFTMLCYFSGTDPAEIGLSTYENALRGSVPFDKSPDGVQKISKDKGLNTFLYHIMDTFNATGVWKEITKLPVVCKFNGLVVIDKQVKINIDTAKLKTYSSINDLRKENRQPTENLDYAGTNVYDIVAPENPMVIAAMAAKEAKAVADKQAQQAQAQAQQEAVNAQTQQPAEADQNLISAAGQPV
jgi:hypothetical protein